jgi:cytochrome c556
MTMATAEHKQAARELFEFERAKARAAGLSRSKANERAFESLSMGQMEMLREALEQTPEDEAEFDAELDAFLDKVDEYDDAEAEWLEEIEDKLHHLKPLVDSKGDEYLSAKFEQLCEAFDSKPDLGEER